MKVQLSATCNTSLLDLLFTVTQFLVWLHLYCSEGLHFRPFILDVTIPASQGDKRFLEFFHISVERERLCDRDMRVRVPEH